MQAMAHMILVRCIRRKKIALAVVLKVGKLLEANSKVDVTIPRKTDILLTWLRERILQIGLMPIFLFHSLYANRNTAADGTETYVMGMNKVASNLEAAKRRTLLH
jgi:N-acetylmuramoyl-L-alanine amidase